MEVEPYPLLPTILLEVAAFLVLAALVWVYGDG